MPMYNIFLLLFLVYTLTLFPLLKENTARTILETEMADHLQKICVLLLGFETNMLQLQCITFTKQMLLSRVIDSKGIQTLNGSELDVIKKENLNDVPEEMSLCIHSRINPRKAYFAQAVKILNFSRVAAAALR